MAGIVLTPYLISQPCYGIDAIINPIFHIKNLMYGNI